jgi:hypothetical protein
MELKDGTWIGKGQQQDITHCLAQFYLKVQSFVPLAENCQYLKDFVSKLFVLVTFPDSIFAVPL